MTPLGVLNRFSNRDKHRALAVYTTLIDENAVRDAFAWQPEALLIEETVYGPDPGESLEDGAELVRLRFDPRGAKPRVQVKVPIELTPVLGYQNWRASIGIFPDMAKRVSEVIADFDQFFA